jgi:preprotein translocase subunit SecG
MLLADSLISGVQPGGVAWWCIHFFFEFFISALALFLILLVLVQRGRGGGIAGALGGMGGNSAFGTKAGDTFTWITYGTAAVWILLAMVTIKTFTDPVKDKQAFNSKRKERQEDRDTKLSDGTLESKSGKNDNLKTDDDLKTDDARGTKPEADMDDETGPGAGKDEYPAKTDGDQPKSGDEPGTTPEPDSNPKPDDQDPDQKPGPDKPGEPSSDESK